MNVEGKYAMSATENELVSIIVPVYNVEQQLDRCVASLDGQSYADIEIILVDDGSTDGSPAICDAWKKKEPRVKVVHQREKHGCGAGTRRLDLLRGQRRLR